MSEQRPLLTPDEFFALADASFPPTEPLGAEDALSKMCLAYEDAYELLMAAALWKPTYDESDEHRCEACGDIIYIGEPYLTIMDATCRELRWRCAASACHPSRAATTEQEQPDAN